MSYVRRLLIVSSVVVSSLLGVATASAQTPELLYGADGAQGNLSNLYVINPATGAVSQTIGPIGFAVTGLAIDPATGALYGATSRSTSGGASNPGHIITINKTTGAGTLVGDEDTSPADQGAADITFTPDGTLYGWLEASADDLATINKTTGAATIVGNAGLSTAGSGLAADSSGTLYFAGDEDSGPLRTINRTTGAPTTVATMNGTTGDEVSALAFNEAGTLYGVVLNTSPTPATAGLITINKTTGAVTPVGPTINRLDAIVFQPAVPAPPPPNVYYEEDCGFTINGKDLNGTSGNDDLDGSVLSDRLKGGDGNDELNGLQERDCLFGNADKDTVKGGDGDDVMRGGSGNDKLRGGDDNDSIRAQDGDDKVKGQAGDDRIRAKGRGSDKVNCGSGDDKAFVDPKDTVSNNCEKVKVSGS
jgi:Ca2+-binding RTX toxin-like protein